MANPKTVVFALVAVAAGVGALFASGAINLRSGSSPTPEADEGKTIDQLESLGYAGAVEVRAEHRDKVGVTRAEGGKFDPEGLGIGTPLGWGAAYHRAGGKRSMNEARLIDMRGKVRHRWEYRVKRNDLRHGWDLARLDGKGNLYALYDRNALLVLDWDSNLIRRTRGRFHHDFALTDDGGVVIMDEQRRTLVDPVDKYEYDLLDHGFTFIDAEGKVQRTLWLHDALKDQPAYQKHLERKLDRWRPARTKRGEPNQLADFQHANTVEILRDGVDGLWEPGDLMTTVRELDMIVVVSADDGGLRWMWGAGVLDRPHDPSQVEGARLMVFDNGWHKERSRVLQLTAPAGTQTWAYEGRPDDPFFSKKRGLAQMLDDGHVVINSTQNARTFEVDAEGTIVWEYFAPDLLGEFRVPMRYIRLHGDALAAARERLSDGAP